jgi:hypothetical protein
MKFSVYKEPESWPFKWFWKDPREDLGPENVRGHGAYPTRWIAWLAAWRHTR